MLIRIAFIFFSTISIASAQNYAPFHGNVSKRFEETNNPLADDYFFYADTSYVTGNTQTFQQYYTSKTVDYFEDIDCPFWGQGSTMTLDTTWLGNVISYNTFSKKLALYNRENDTLHFDFSLALNDSSLIYSGNGEHYFLKQVGASLENVFTEQDSVKTFQVKHYDTNGNPILSPLHDFEIKLGKNLGLLRFFDTYHFPETEIPLQLKGQLFPLIGSYHMKYEELYDWQIGDILQFKGIYQPANYMGSSIQYKTMTITDRIEDANSITYHYVNSSFLGDSLPQGLQNIYNISYPNPLVVSKNGDVLGIPHNKALTNTIPLRTYSEDSISYCGSDKYAVRLSGAFLQYCDSCRCFGGVDGFGTSYPVMEYTKGLGVTKHVEVGYGPFGTLPYFYAELVYYFVNGEECGTRVYMNLPQNIAETVTLYPNPSSDKLYTNRPFSSFVLYDVNGKQIHASQQTNSSIDISFLPNGLYTIVLLIDGQSIRKQWLKI